MRFLLVDDDKIIRFSLKSMLLDIFPNDCFISEASNGLEMINRCNEYEPDIAFVDIRMPNLDGLSAISTCKKLSANTSFIVISGYSDFEYAKECIKLGVTDYILKPIDPQTLEKLIAKCQNTLLERKQMQNNIFQLQMHDFFHMPSGGAAEISNEAAQSILPDVLLSFTIFIDCSNNHNMFSNIQSNLISSLKIMGAQMIDKDINYSLDYSLDGYLYITYKTPPEKIAGIKHKIEFLCRQYDSSKLHLYLFISSHTNQNELYKTFHFIENYSPSRMDKQPCTAIDINNFDTSSYPASFFNQLDALLNAFQNSNEILYTQYLNNIYREYCDNPPLCCLKYLSAYVYCITGFTPDAADFKSFMHSFVSFSENMYQNIAPQGNKIDSIIEYINHSFTSDISINQIADKFELTPNYVSKLFHEKTNVLFIDYLTDLRMKYAKKILIEQPDTPLKEVALMLGYYSPRHFASIFKKYSGVSPSEYRKNF